MGAAERKKRLFENVRRLRRAERAGAGARDIVAVRADLERELGETVSQRLAADILGISHTALRRWVGRGDIPVVHNADGRMQIPVHALLDLSEAIDLERKSGSRSLHLVEPSMLKARERARELDPGGLVPADVATPDPHERASRRSLAYHRAIARRLRRSMADEALHRIWAWRDQGRIDARYADRWEQVLRAPVAEIRAILGEDTPAGRDLRQNSPFAGVLSEAERNKIVREVR